MVSWFAVFGSTVTGMDTQETPGTEHLLLGGESVPQAAPVTTTPLSCTDAGVLKKATYSVAAVC